MALHQYLLSAKCSLSSFNWLYEKQFCTLSMSCCGCAWNWFVSRGNSAKINLRKRMQEVFAVCCQPGWKRKGTRLIFNDFSGASTSQQLFRDSFSWHIFGWFYSDCKYRQLDLNTIHTGKNFSYWLLMPWTFQIRKFSQFLLRAVRSTCKIVMVWTVQNCAKLFPLGRKLWFCPIICIRSSIVFVFYFYWDRQSCPRPPVRYKPLIKCFLWQSITM